MKLIAERKSQAWLIGEIKKRTGMYVDGSILFKVLTGQVNSKRITEAIEDILGVSVSRQVSNKTDRKEAQ